MVNLSGAVVQKKTDWPSPDLLYHFIEVTKKGFKTLGLSCLQSRHQQAGRSFTWMGVKRSRETLVEKGFSVAACSLEPDDFLLWEASLCTASSVH